MIINELFDRVIELEPISTAVVQLRFDMSNICGAYRLFLGEDEYIFFFQRDMGTNVSFNFGKAQLRASGGEMLKYHPTQMNTDQFKIIPAAIQVLNTFISKINPLSITFFGASSRQNVLYSKMSRFLQHKLPTPYKLARSENDLSKIIITRLDPEHWSAKQWVPFS